MRCKYPRTPHLPWSPGATEDDIRADCVVHFEGREVVVTEKMDGENASIYRDGYHARSLDSRHHPSRDWIKRRQAEVGYLVPEGFRICGENLYAEHSIRYECLESYFYAFSIWDEENRCLSWDDTVEWCERIGLVHVPVLWRGEWDEEAIRGIDVDTTTQEGYVVRTVDAFPFHEFADHVRKWVRPDHVETDEHWMHREVVPNGLREEA